ncbi:MAG: hypothetical protein ACPGJS_18300 [Flammeovirgaceae bacterium]
MDPLDSGPIYKETLMGRFPVEPWNTASNLLFLFIVIYWALKVYKNYRTHRFIAFCLPVLFIGYIGGTVYHATRSHEAWLLMDWVPILLLCLSVSIYFSIKQRLAWYHIFLLISLPMTLSFSLRHVTDVSRNVGSIVSYSMMAFVIVYPIANYLRKTNWENHIWMLLAVGAFIAAITFRSIDKLVYFELLPMGTHWLWHSFGALSAHFLMVYIYRDGLRYPSRLMT